MLAHGRVAVAVNDHVNVDVNNQGFWAMVRAPWG